MLISIICPTYARTDFLEEAVYSCLNQSYQNIELIILNDFKKQKIKFNHPKVKIHNYDERIPTLGEKKNILANLAKGEIVIPLDDDDILLPNYIENIIKHIGAWSWMLPFKTLVYNVNHNIMQLSVGGPLNTFIYRKKVALLTSYPSVNFNVNKEFIYNTRKRFGGIMLKLPFDDIGYISRWDEFQSQGYHVREIGRTNIDDKTRVDKIHEFINKSNFKEGDIYLEPKWNKNYIGMVNELKNRVIEQKAY